MGREDIKIKSVGFDTTIPLHIKLLAIADNQKNFSEYVRTLMVADMLTNGAISDLSIVRQKKSNVISKEYTIEIDTVENREELKIHEGSNKKKYDPKDFTIDL